MKNSGTRYLAIMVLLCGLTAHAQDTEVTWSAFTTGFGVLSDGNTEAQVVTGQPFAGALEGPNISVGGGFLYNPAITGQQFSLSVSLQEGWNLISLPVTRDSTNDSVRQAYPTATYEHGFAYVPGVGYAQEFRLANGVGYWIKFPSTEIAYVTGEARPADTLYVQAGWNLVGSISSIIDTATIVSDPPYNRISPWFGYFGGLTPVEVITPGYAYWVKADAAGTFILAAAAARPEGRKEVSPLSELNTLVVTDAKGRSQTLYFGDQLSGKLDPRFFELPPGGPEGAFDARFESQRMVERVAGETPVLIRSSAYPITLRWNVKSGSQFNMLGADGTTRTISGSGEIQIGDHTISRIIISPTATVLPGSFSLEQNHPNPFNPVSTITFALPARGSSPGTSRQGGTVSLQVFDLLGRNVATLVDGEMEPGVHTVRFDATALASGVYLYRLQAGEFVQTRKMMLLR